MDVQCCKASVFMMKYGAYIPLSGMPFSHDPRTFPRLKKWQIAASLEVVHQYRLLSRSTPERVRADWGEESCCIALHVPGVDPVARANLGT